MWYIFISIYYELKKGLKKEICLNKNKKEKIE